MSDEVDILDIPVPEVPEVPDRFFTTSNNIEYYAFQNTSKVGTYNQAVAKCSSLDMVLASFDSTEKYDDFYNKISTLQLIGSFWIGAVGNGISFAWLSSGNPVIPSLWGTDSPPGLFNCVLTPSASRGLKKQDCSTPYYFPLCENRVKPERCCKKKTNIFLNIKQQNL